MNGTWESSRMYNQRAPIFIKFLKSSDAHDQSQNITVFPNMRLYYWSPPLIESGAKKWFIKSPLPISENIQLDIQNRVGGSVFLQSWHDI